MRCVAFPHASPLLINLCFALCGCCCLLPQDDSLLSEEEEHSDEEEEEDEEDKEDYVAQGEAY